MKSVAGKIQNNEMSIRKATDEFSVPKSSSNNRLKMLKKKVKLFLCLTN
jgi:hypothetical protein